MEGVVHFIVRPRTALLDEAARELGPDYVEMLSPPELFRCLPSDDTVDDFKSTFVRWFARQFEASRDARFVAFVQARIPGSTPGTFDQWWTIEVLDDVVEYDDVKQELLKP